MEGGRREGGGEGKCLVLKFRGACINHTVYEEQVHFLGGRGGGGKPWPP